MIAVRYIYPVVTMEEAFAHSGSRIALLGSSPTREGGARHSPDRWIRPGAPEVFLALADDDAAVPSENAVRLYRALKRAGTRAEMHIYREGGHGFTVDPTSALPVQGWTRLAVDWLKRIGVV